MAKSAKLKTTGQRKGTAQRPAKQKPKYAQEPTREEYQSFPPGYRLEHGSWPAEEILEVKGARGPEKNRRYLIQWKPHPFTLQYFEPSWVGHGEVTQDLLAYREENQRTQTTPSTVSGKQNEDNIGDSSSVAAASERILLRFRKRKLSSSEFSDSHGEQNTLDGTTRRRKRQKSLRNISDGSSEAEEDTGTQASSNVRSQATASTRTGSLRSPPPEIEDSQEPVPQPRSTISVLVTPRPSESQLAQFIPISSGLEFESSSQVFPTFEANPSSEATASDYPTPQSEQVQSPAISDASFLYPEAAQSSPRGSLLISQTQRQNSAPSFGASSQVSVPLLTQVISSGLDSSVQVRASSSISQSRQYFASNSPPSAEASIGLTSPINETQASLGAELTSLSNSDEFQTPLSQQPKNQQSQILQRQSPGSSTRLFSQTSIGSSPLRTQISPSQPRRQTLFRTSQTEGIGSWSNQVQISPRRRLQSPFQLSQSRLEKSAIATSVALDLEGSPSSSSFRQIDRRLVTMAAPPHRSSPRTGGVSTPSRTSRATPLSLPEQLAQSRASRQRNAASASPIEAPAKAPIIPQIREPTPIQLTTMISNPALPKTEIPEIEPTSAMQVDSQSSQEASHGSAQPNNEKMPPGPNLHIQQSIERDEPDKVDSSTQDSSILESSEVQENGHVINSSNHGLMPNHPILLPGEFAIPLHAEGKTQDAYRDAVLAKQKAMFKYLRRGSSSSTPSSSGPITPKTEANEMAELVGKLDAIVSLLDLGYDGMLTQSSFSGTQLARWTVKASSKFAFVKTLIDALQLYECSLIIFARAGQTQQLFEHFLSTFDVDFRTYTGSGEAVPGATSQGKVTVHLIAGGQRPHFKLKPGPSLIIAFDNSYDPRSEYVLNLRGEEGKQLPVIHLLVSNSSEHIERCLPVNMPSPQRNRLLVQSILQGSRYMGKILSEMNEATLEYYSHLSGGTRIIDDDLMRREQVFQKMPDFHLKRLAQQVGKALIEEEFSTTWSTVPPMPPLELDEIPGLITQQLKIPSPSPMPASPVGTPSLRKRFLDGDGLDTPGGSKRQRMTPVPGVSPHEQGEAAQIHHLQQALKAAKDDAANEKLARMGAEDARDKARIQLNEWRQSVSELQKRVEYHRDQDHKARTKIKNLNKDAERFVALRERDAADREKLKLENNQLREELVNIRADLKNAGGDTATLEQAREEARTSSATLAKAEKDLASAKQQGEYFRVQYQETMATGRQHQADAEELKAKVKDLEIDASDEKRRLKLVNFDEAANAHMVRIERLELEKRALESMVKKLNAENMSLKATRGLSTRASSVQPPGSPRAREAKSRGGSPVPGLIGAGYSGSRASALRHER